MSDFDDVGLDCELQDASLYTLKVSWDDYRSTGQRTVTWEQ